MVISTKTAEILERFECGGTINPGDYPMVDFLANHFLLKKQYGLDIEKMLETTKITLFGKYELDEFRAIICLGASKDVIDKYAGDGYSKGVATVTLV
jgi:hypothetical protein